MAKAPQNAPRQARLPVSQALSELGAAGESNRYGIERDEFLNELRGARGMRKYREMGDNDPVVGAILYAVSMMLRAVSFRAEAVNDSEEAQEAAAFVDDVFENMDGSWDEFLSRALSYLQYGFSYFEAVYKRRRDGLIGVKSFAPRPQPTLSHWAFTDDGQLEGMVQTVPGTVNTILIPLNKALHFRTVTTSDSPSGRSILRNAYRGYYYASNIENIEAIAIERELNGLPVAYIPSEYLTASSGPQRAFRDKLEQILRDVRLGEQSYAVFPSDYYVDESSGEMTNQRMFEFKLAASEGSRDIDTGTVVNRHRQGMAQSIMADFVMLGQSDKGSFALSKNKTDLFLRSLEGHAENIAGVLNRQFLPRLWALNGMDPELMPTIVAGAIAPVDLDELGSYIKSLAGAGFALFPNDSLEQALLEAADLPTDGVGEDADIFGAEPVAGAEPADDDESVSGDA